LVANDLFSAANVDFHPQFQAVLRRTIVEHGRHIVDNLEWDPGFRGNHYLANIAGLLFIAAYLPRSGETDAWLAFAIQELKGEAARQFLADGANFEASTCYHRLAGEMLVYGTAVVLGLTEHKKAALREYEHHRWRRRPRLRRAPITLLPLPGGAGESPFSALHFERLERAAEFTLHLSKPSGRVAQIGDNDSGRFLKILPLLRRCTVAQARARWANLDDYTALADDAPYWEEDHLDHRPFIAAVHGLLERDDFAAISSERSLEAWLVSRFAGGRRVRPYPKTDGSTAAERRVKELPGTLDRLEEKLLSLPDAQRRTIELAAPGGSLRDGLVLYAYPLFGSYIFQSRRLFLAVRCGPIGQGGFGGHAHNDQLSMEVTLDGEDWVADPGSYLYTALPDRRNQYRSMWAHFGPRFASGEPASLALGLFRLGSESVASCLHFSPAGFAGVLRSRSRTTHSIVRVGDQALTVQHFCVGDRFPAGTPDGRDWRSGLPGVPFSPGYGIVTRDPAAVSPLRIRVEYP